MTIGPPDPPALDLAIQTFRRRLEQSDPSVLGLYAEALVATALGEVLFDSAWGSWDLKWKPPGAERSVGIQVKSLSTRPTLIDHRGRIIAKRKAHLSFSIRSVTDDDLIWVFALHTGDRFDTDWWFFVAPASLLRTIATKSVSVRRLWSRLGPPVGVERLAAAIEHAASGRQTAPDDWPCPVCGNRAISPTQLAAHIAVGNKRRCSDAMTRLIHDPGSVV